MKKWYQELQVNKKQPLVIIKDKSEIYPTMGAIDTDEPIPTKCHSLRLRRSDHKRNPFWCHLARIGSKKPYKNFQAIENYKKNCIKT